ncbi:MAG: hypothetical protein J0G98_20200 [Terrimonas ferruginea]|nr:hypothetical protein [Terrimonas ferruginea]
MSDTPPTNPAERPAVHHTRAGATIAEIARLTGLKSTEILSAYWSRPEN